VDAPAHAGRRARASLSWPVAAALVAATLLAASAHARAATASPLAALTALEVSRVASSGEVVILGSVACARPLCLRLYLSGDAGAHVTALSLPPYGASPDSPTGTIRAILFVSPRVGFALADAAGRATLYATDDAARTWHARLVERGVTLADLAAGSHSLYLVSYRCSAQANGNEGCTDYSLLASTWGARHWRSTPIPHGTAYPWGFLGNVAAAAGRVWLTEGARWSALVSSSDEGRTLVTTSVGDLLSTAGCELTATSARALWAQCPGGMQSRFAYSGDAGATWTLVPAGQWMDTGGGAFDPVSPRLAFLDYGQRVGAAALYRVVDAGRRLVAVSRPRCTSLSSLVFVSAREGLLVCGYSPHARLERTGDGGVTWTRLSAR
jgi:hypothetical protein